ncbi:MAG: hypothetical protein Q7K65_04430 [Candidatus Buchananbacteria bacterium]|nr:hypothetical protein [Candidatus Buchananbacteria bacterium]
MVKQKKQVVVNGEIKNREWVVDTDAIRSIRGNDWTGDYPRLIQTDLEQMAETFPHWFLTVGSSSRPIACQRDGDYFIPKDGTLQCVNCGQAINQNPSCLIWTGLLPVQIVGAEKVSKHIRSLIAKGNMKLPYVGDEAAFLLTPIRIIYPPGWPNVQPSAYYTREFFSSLGIGPPGTSHAHHMYEDLRMCLFASWHTMTIREVIQNRIAPHALAQVKIANGERPNSRWFN